MIITLSVTIGVLLLVLSIAIRFLIKFSLALLRIQESMQTSLDLLDESYGEIGRILGTPVGSDSDEVRQVLYQIRRAQSAVLTAAAQLTAGWKSSEDEKETS